jgi:uncharacterized cupredoxin-like copper-binding protein
MKTFERGLHVHLLVVAMVGASLMAQAHEGPSDNASAPHGSHAGGHRAAIGEPGQPAAVSRSVEVEMTDDMRFTPARVDAKQGETIRFVVKNAGRLKHEFVLGTDSELKAHYTLMKKFPEMTHQEPNQVSLAAGETGEVIWRFSNAGPVPFACLQPGHYDAGMKGRVQVAAVKQATKPRTKADAGASHPH